MTLRCVAYQLPGITSDQTASASGSANTWEQLTISISPTSKGVIQLEMFAYGGTTYNGYVDDLTVGGVNVSLDYPYMGGFADPLVSAGGGGLVVKRSMGGGFSE